MSDLRQGVTGAGHAVLDSYDKRRSAWGQCLTVDLQLNWAANLVMSASTGNFPLKLTREMAIEAAARLIDAVGEIDRRIATGDA
jgi:hypothetical protein